MLWKVYQYPVPFRCWRTGAGFFIYLDFEIFNRVEFDSFNMVEIDQFNNK